MNKDEICELCGHDIVEILSTRDYRRPFDMTEYRLVWCHNCAVGRLAGSFSHKDVGSFFDIPYYTHGSDGIGKSGPLGSSAKHGKNSFFDRLTAHLAWRCDRGQDLTAAELGPANNRTLCDLGCGDGKNIKHFKDAGFQVVGVEPDPIARSKAEKIAEVFDGTVEELPGAISARRFDVVLLSHVFDVCLDRKKSLANVRSIVKPDGKVVIEVPNFAAKGFQVFGAEWPWTDIPRHLSFFTEKSLKRTLEVGGFSLQKVQYVGFTRQFLPNWRATQDTIRRSLGGAEPRTTPSFLWLVQTAFAPPALKYDSVRVVAIPR
jgi:SAM-dependent methyltransferase